MLVKKCRKLMSEKGGIAFFVASLCAWIFLMGLTVDFSRALVVKRWTYIQLDHALKTAAKQIDEEHLADLQVVILEDEAQEAFGNALAEGLKLTNHFPEFPPNANTAYADNLTVLEFEVLNYDDPAEPNKITDPFKSAVEFDHPTCHAIVEVPIETVFWRWFGIKEMTLRIHADASCDLIFPEEEGGSNFDDFEDDDFEGVFDDEDFDGSDLDEIFDGDDGGGSGGVDDEFDDSDFDDEFDDSDFDDEFDDSDFDP